MKLLVFMYSKVKTITIYTFFGRKKEMSPTFANRRFRAKKNKDRKF